MKTRMIQWQAARLFSGVYLPWWRTFRERDALVPVSKDVVSRGADMGCFNIGDVERRERHFERADDDFGDVYEDGIDLSQVFKLGVFQKLQVVDDCSICKYSGNVFLITQGDEFFEDIGLLLDGLRGG